MIKQKRNVSLKAKDKRHDGFRISSFRAAIGMSQEDLGRKLKTTQQNISKLEQQEELEEEVFAGFARALGVQPEVLRNFNPDGGTVYHIQTMNDSSFINNINPLEHLLKQVEENKALHERLLQAEKDKVELLQQTVGTLKNLLDK